VKHLIATAFIITTIAACSDSGDDGLVDAASFDIHQGACGYAGQESGDANLRCLKNSYSYDAQATGREIAFDITVVNDYTGVGPFRTGYYLYPANGSLCNGYIVAQSTREEGLPNGLVYLDIRGTLDLSQIDYIPPGTYHFGFVADYENAIGENNESDNLCLWDTSSITL